MSWKEIIFWVWLYANRAWITAKINIWQIKIKYFLGKILVAILYLVGRIILKIKSVFKKRTVLDDIKPNITFETLTRIISLDDFGFLELINTYNKGRVIRPFRELIEMQNDSPHKSMILSRMERLKI